MSELLFCAICLAALLALSKAAAFDNKILLAAGVAILSLAAGLRAPDVGIDTYDYYNAFATDFAWHPWQFDEEGFRAIARFFMAIFHDPNLVFLVFAVITNGLMFRRLWDFRNDASFSFMAFFYIAVFYIGTMNTMRQYLAVAIVFFATRFLDRDKYLPFVIALAIAASIHTTALMGVAYLFIYMWTNTKGKKRVYMAVAATLLIPVVCVALITYESGHIENYFSNSTDNVNITFIYRIGTFAIACLLMWLPNRRSIGFAKGERAEAERRDPSAFACLLGLVSASAGMFFTYLERLGYYFLMFEAVFWGKAVKHEAWGWLYWLMPTVYALYSFGYELAFNGSGIFPFHFIFD